MTPRYRVTIGQRRPNKREVAVETLAEAFKVVRAQGNLEGQGEEREQRVIVWDRDPGWWHPIYDSQEVN